MAWSFQLNFKIDIFGVTIRQMKQKLNFENRTVTILSVSANFSSPVSPFQELLNQK